MSHLTRRTFLKRAAATAGVSTALAISGTKASGNILGANDKIRLGVAGINGRGKTHISEFAPMDGVEVSYLIDPDARLHESRSAMVQSKGGNRPKCVQDIREALDDKNLDAVSVATCNHWHALITFWSCQAKKDVYVEKPCSHTVFEGRKCVEAAEKYGCVVQHGTQSRASAKWADQIAAIASGKYGKLLVSKAYASKPRWSIGFKENKQPPAELDFNLWLGPAQKMPYNENLVHYNWHWFWPTGNGEIGNQGVHQMDIARWAIPAATLPKRVVSMGGRWVNSSEGHPPFTDQAVTPNMHLTVFDFGETLLVYEIAGLCGKTIVPGGKAPERRVDNEFYLEEGVITGGKFYRNGSDQGESIPASGYNSRGESQFENFIRCVRDHTPEKLFAPIQEAHPSAALCHLGNISYRLGKQVPGTTKPADLGDCRQAQDSWSHIVQGLKNALGLDLATSSYQLGPRLNFDAKTEKFVGNDQANALLTRNYRKPFVVTEEV